MRLRREKNVSLDLFINGAAVIALVERAILVARELEQYDPELGLQRKREIAELALATVPETS